MITRFADFAGSGAVLFRFEFHEGIPANAGKNLPALFPARISV
jgi:hypothetical protein